MFNNGDVLQVGDYPIASFYCMVADAKYHIAQMLDFECFLCVSHSSVCGLGARSALSLCRDRFVNLNC